MVAHSLFTLMQVFDLGDRLELFFETFIGLFAQSRCPACLKAIHDIGDKCPDLLRGHSAEIFQMTALIPAMIAPAHSHVVFDFLCGLIDTMDDGVVASLTPLALDLLRQDIGWSRPWIPPAHLRLLIAIARRDRDALLAYVEEHDEIAEFVGRGLNDPESEIYAQCLIGRLGEEALFGDIKVIVAP
jgi:hypothetical protein